MSLLEGLQISVIGLGTVFIVLIALSTAVSLESKIFNIFGKRREKHCAVEVSDDSEKTALADTAAGQLKLIDVDERTAAMIMAIVSDESQIPLSELNFKYIKAID